MHQMGVSVATRLGLWVPVACYTLLWAYMQWHDKLPSVDSMAKLVAVVNSRGGNIVILAAGALYFFKYSMYLFMMLLNMVREKTITQDNAFALMAIQFITTSAFGGAMGALLKTMTGENEAPPLDKTGATATNTLTASGGGIIETRSLSL